MILSTLALLGTLHAPELASGCAPPDEWRPYAPREQRIAARKRAMRACRKLGASVEACNVLDVISVRESSGDPCAVHVLGPKEYGLGLHGLSAGLHLAKWSTFAYADELRIPEVSTVVTMRIFRRAVVRYRARTWREVGGVFAGRRYDRGAAEPFCRRLERVGIDCEGDPRGQLGERLGREPTAGQEVFVLRLMARAKARGG